MQRERAAAALLTGPSEASSSQSQSGPDLEKQQLLERIQQLEAAGHGSPARWQGPSSLAGEDQHLRSAFCSGPTCVQSTSGCERMTIKTICLDPSDTMSCYNCYAASACSTYTCTAIWAYTLEKHFGHNNASYSSQPGSATTAGHAKDCQGNSILCECSTMPECTALT